METAPQRKSGVNTGRMALLVVIALAAAVIVWLFVKDDNDGTQPKRATPAAASVSDLKALARSVGHPVYWVGSRPGYTYELSRTKDGSIYIRYLPPGIEVGTEGANYLTVGTYPNNRAFTAVKEASRQPNETIRKLPRGGLAVSNPARNGSVYVAHPDDNFLIEIYAPSAARAFKLATTGKLVAVG